MLSDIVSLISGPPSPPRYLSRSIVGVAENKYHFSWLASRNTGGLPVNYSVELCVTHVNIKMCKWSMKPECRPRNIRNNQQKFSCLLDGDFFPSYSRQAYDYTLHVWAENELGNASSALFSPVVPYRSGIRRLLHRKCNVRICIHELQNFGKLTRSLGSLFRFPKFCSE